MRLIPAVEELFLRVVFFAAPEPRFAAFVLRFAIVSAPEVPLPPDAGIAASESQWCPAAPDIPRTRVRTSIHHPEAIREPPAHRSREAGFPVRSARSTPAHEGARDRCR